jgi:WD40 repeat protein
MVIWHPAEDILVSASYDDTIKVWREDQDDWYCAATLRGHTSTVWGIDFDTTGNFIGIFESSLIITNSVR